MLRKIRHRLASASRDIRLFSAVIALLGFGQAVFDSVFNNFLNDTFAITSLQRSLLEFPRELPGLLVVFVSALLFFMCSRRLAALALFLQGLGLVLMTLFGSHWSGLLVWLFVLSLGQHLFLPLSSSLGMELARKGAAGKRLGQFNALRNLTTILGSFLVYLGFRYLHFSFKLSFMIAAAGFFCAAYCLFLMEPDKPQPARLRLKLHREYGLFYWLNVLYGTRKQIFLTFAPWVLVTIFHQPTQMVAKLLVVGGITGIVFQPILGKAIDRLGEKKILAAEAVLLVFVCLGYGFSRSFFGGQAAFLIAAVCYVADQMLISVSMARATYLKKIALDPEHVAPTLSMGMSIDHFFSIAIALAGGVIWFRYGYQYVFLCAALIAVVNFFSVLRIRVPVSRSIPDAGVT